jgi:hypothetical protein
MLRLRAADLSACRIRFFRLVGMGFSLLRRRRASENGAMKTTRTPELDRAARAAAAALTRLAITGSERDLRAWIVAEAAWQAARVLARPEPVPHTS